MFFPFQLRALRPSRIPSGTSSSWIALYHSVLLNSIWFLSWVNNWTEIWAEGVGFCRPEYTGFKNRWESFLDDISNVSCPNCHFADRTASTSHLLVRIVGDLLHIPNAPSAVLQDDGCNSDVVNSGFPDVVGWGRLDTTVILMNSPLWSSRSVNTAVWFIIYLHLSNRHQIMRTELSSFLRVLQWRTRRTSLLHIGFGVVCRTCVPGLRR